MKKIAEVKNDNGTLAGWRFQCPACGHAHMFFVKMNNGTTGWNFNGNFDKPTFTPSLLNWHDGRKYDDGHHIPPFRCHLFVRDGMVEFCGDCTHSMAGKKVPLPDLP